MRLLLLPFLLLAATGFALSVSAHILALLGQVPPGGPLVMSLHMGIFIVWIPTVLLSIRVTKGARRNDFWKIMLSGCPAWMRYLLYGLFGYAVLNFLFFLISQGSTHHHGIDELSPEMIRGFSGHWMVFYWAAFASLYSVRKAPQLLQERKCCNGHVVSLTDAFCPTCGKALVGR